MRISFFKGGLVLAIMAAMTTTSCQALKLIDEPPEAYELSQINADSLQQGTAEPEEALNLAQTGAEAGAEVMYFKKIVNFAKDAINTIAPALSSMNKFGASTAGIVNVT